MLGGLARGLAEDRLLLIAIDLCTDSVAASNDSLSRLRRLDAVLDILDVPAATSAVEAHFAFVLEQLLTAAGKGFDTAGAARAARPYAEALAFFHPALGLAASFGLNRIDRSTDDDALVPPPAQLCELARSVTAIQTAFGGSEQVANADRLNASLLQRLRDGHGEPAAVARASAMLREINGTKPLEIEQIPEMAGHSLRAARRILSNLGLSCEVVDDLRPGGSTRFVISDANWTVTTQTCVVAGRVVLGVRKHSDASR